MPLTILVLVKLCSDNNNTFNYFYFWQNPTLSLFKPLVSDFTRITQIHARHQPIKFPPFSLHYQKWLIYIKRLINYHDKIIDWHYISSGGDTSDPSSSISFSVLIPPPYLFLIPQNKNWVFRWTNEISKLVSVSGWASVFVMMMHTDSSSTLLIPSLNICS